MSIDLTNVRIITVTYESQAPDVYCRTRREATVWSKIVFDPHVDHDAYQIESNYTAEDILDELPDVLEEHGISVDYTPFTD